MLEDLYYQDRKISSLFRFLGIALVMNIGALGLGVANQALSLERTSTDGSLLAVDRDIGLPKILSEIDAVFYRRIFTLQETGEWKAADRLIKRVEDGLLVGHVQFQRYMHPRKYRSRYRELKGWLAQYADHPGATRIYKLALRRRPKNHRMPMAPVGPSGIHGLPILCQPPTIAHPENAARRSGVACVKSNIKFAEM